LSQKCNSATLAVSDVSVAEKLVTDPRVAFFSFIGSANIGWMLRSKLAAGTRCALEHGGAAPVIIDESADMPSMIPSLVKGGFYHAGQVCVSVQRVFAPRTIAADVARAIADAAEKLIVGNAINADTEVGPLIRPAEVTRVEQWVDEAVDGGAQVFCGAHKLGETTYAPTVLLDPPVLAKVSTQEIFGPVVCVYGYDDLDTALAQANSLPFAFQAACFSNRLDTALKCVQQLDASKKRHEAMTEKMKLVIEACNPLITSLNEQATFMARDLSPEAMTALQGPAEELNGMAQEGIAQIDAVMAAEGQDEAVLDDQAG
jgi:acyl-CoA reductase-like NAD-dependent aldehyde dehydrogenase